MNGKKWDDSTGEKPSRKRSGSRGGSVISGFFTKGRAGEDEPSWEEKKFLQKRRRGGLGETLSCEAKKAGGHEARGG